MREQNQALDVDLQEPNMEISAKQEGTKRFDDAGIAAALAGDADADGPGGGLLSGVVNRGKLEPNVRDRSQNLFREFRSSYPRTGLPSMLNQDRPCSMVLFS